MIRYTTFAGRNALLCAALAFSLGSASAQLSTNSDASNSVTVPSSDSSSNALQLTEDTGMPDLATLPAAPAANGAAGGQYDNRSHGGGGGGIMSHMTYEVGGGF